MCLIVFFTIPKFSKRYIVNLKSYLITVKMFTRTELTDVFYCFLLYFPNFQEGLL